MLHKRYRRVGVDFWRSKQVCPVFRVGFGRFAWRLASITSVVASAVAFFAPHFYASDISGGAPLRELNPWRMTVRQAPLATIEARGAFIDCALSSDGALLAAAIGSSASNTRKTITLQIWDARSGNLLRTVATVPQGSRQIHFSADSKDVLVVAPQHLLVFDAKTGASEESIALPKDASGKAAFSADGKRMAIPNSAGKVYLLSPATGRVSRTITPQRDYRRDPDTDTLNLAFSPDNTMLAISASANPPYIQDAFPEPAAMLTLWDVTSGICLQSTTAGRFVVDSVAFSRTESVVNTAGQMFGMRDDGYFGASMVFDRRTGISNTGVYNRDDADVRVTYISPNGFYFVGATEANLYVWDAATFRLEDKVALSAKTANNTNVGDSSDPQPFAVHFSNDGSTIAVDDTHRVRLFHAHGL